MIIKNSFTIENETQVDNRTIGRFEAFFPDEDAQQEQVVGSDIPSFVKITIGKKSAIFRVVHVNAAGSVFISPKAIKLTEELKKLTPHIIEEEAKNFYRYKLLHDRDQKFAFAGLLLGAGGAAIDVVFAIKKSSLSPDQWAQLDVVTWLWIAGIAKFIGLLLVFFKGLMDTK